jgi:HlyD family secretion protein
MSVGRVLLAAVVGGIGWSGAPAISLSTLAELAPWHANPSASRYELGPVEPAEMIKTVTATGTVEATINVEVGSQLSGQVATLLADFNDVVHKGQILAQLDESTFRAQAEAARGALEGAEADVRVAEAKLARAKIDLEQVDVQRSVFAARAEVARIAGEMALRQASRKAALG